MEHRFGFKDLVLSVILLAILVSIWIAMKQFDRQYELVRTTNAHLQEQQRDRRQQHDELAHMRQLLERGVRINDEAGTSGGPPATGSVDGDNPFVRMTSIRQLSDFAEGDRLIDCFSSPIAKITPLLSTDAYAGSVQDAVLESLCTRDPETLEWRGHLAKHWTISDDGLEISFQLRQGLVFSDGHPLTVRDVVFTFDFIMNPQVAAPRHRAYLENMREVKQTGPDEVTFYFKRPYFESFGLAASFTVLPEHFYSKFEIEDFNRSTGYLLGSGPYRLETATAWTPGSPIQLVRNERYWGVRPAIDRLAIEIVTNDVAKLTMFRNGQIDIFTAYPEQYQEMKQDAKLMERTQQFAYQSPVGGYRYIAWNQSKDGKPSFFADKRVRQAMTMLTNRKQLIQVLMLGMAVETTGPFNPAPGNQQYNRDLETYPYDVQRAVALLREAGYVDRDGDGIVESPDGTPFVFRLTYVSGNPNYEKMVLFLKDAYARAGIVCQPDPLEWSVLTERLTNRQFEAITLAWTAGIETDIYQMFHSDQIQDNGDNFMSYRSEQLDELINAARINMNQDARMQLWRRAHEVIHEDQPYTFLFCPMSLRFFDGRIKNIQMVSLGLNPRDEWYVPAPLQRYTR